MNNIKHINKAYKTRIKPFKFQHRSKPEEVTAFIRQLSILISAGIPLMQALSISENIQSKGTLRMAIQGLKQEVQKGVSLSTALRKHPLLFDELCCGLVEVGELSGTLDQLLNLLSSYRDKSNALKKKIKTALTYPCFVLISALLAITILLIYIVPSFEEMFRSFNLALPLITRILLSFSRILQTYGLAFCMICLFFSFLVFRLYLKNKKFKTRLQVLSLKLPFIGILIQKNNIVRCFRMLSITQAAGLPLTKALPTVSKALTYIPYAESLIQVKHEISQGLQIRTALEKTVLFPNRVLQMVGVGEESGTLEKMLDKIAFLYEEELDIAIARLTHLIEPLTLGFLGISIGGLIAALYLPIFKMGALF